MAAARDMAVCVGVDGCAGGWIAIGRFEGADPVMSVHRGFGDLVAAFPTDACIAVDMPIGLPDRIGAAGRGPERLIRPLLGQRQSSVFSIPSRAAVEASDYAEARRLALATSDPPRSVAKQAWCLFPKIRELDAFLRGDASLAARVYETHPELAFWRLNTGRPMQLPKKVRNRVHEPGMEERTALLLRHGLPEALLRGPLPSGVGSDDRLDAAACLLVAERISRGDVVSYPNPPSVDRHGLRIAIHA